MGKGNVRTIFMLLGTFVLCYIGWALMFGDGGIIKTGYNTVVTNVNNVYAKYAGGTGKILPEWGGDNAGELNKGTGFDGGSK